MIVGVMPFHGCYYGRMETRRRRGEGKGKGSGSEKKCERQNSVLYIYVSKFIPIGQKSVFIKYTIKWCVPHRTLN